MKKEHPRLLLHEDGFTKLKADCAANPQLVKWYGEILKEANRLLSQPPSKYEIPDGKRLLATSRRVADRTYTLALVYRMNGDKKYLDRAWQELDAAARFQDWNPKHFLDTAEMTHAFAIGYDWLYDAWSPAQRDTLAKAIATKGLSAALPLYRKNSGYTRSRHNWNQVCNGGIGMGALAIAEVEPALCGEILQGVVKSLPNAMRESAPDGGWNEGPGYWNYATAYNVVFLAALESSLGSDFGLGKIPGFDQTGWFPIYVSGPFGTTFNYADGGSGAIRAPQMFWLARKFNRPEFSWFALRNATPRPLDLVWYWPQSRGPIDAGLPLAKLFRQTEFATMRSSWDNPNAWFVGLKAGDNKANHSHLDLGSFVLDALGERWAFEYSSDDYNLPGYFGDKRWTYYRLRAEGQNTFVINPDSGPDQDPAATAAITGFSSQPNRMFAVADLTKAYARHASRVQRGVLLAGKSILIQDEFEAKAAVPSWWFMHTMAKIELGSNKRSATLTQDGKTIQARIVSSEKATFSILDAAPLPTSPVPPKQGNNRNAKRLTVKLDPSTSVRLAILFSESAATKPPGIKPLAEW